MQIKDKDRRSPHFVIIIIRPKAFLFFIHSDLFFSEMQIPAHITNVLLMQLRADQKQNETPQIN